MSRRVRVGGIKQKQHVAQWEVQQGVDSGDGGGGDTLVLLPPVLHGGQELPAHSENHLDSSVRSSSVRGCSVS